MNVIITVGTGEEDQGKALIIHAYEHRFLVIAYENLDAMVIGIPGVAPLELNTESAAVYLRGLVEELSSLGAKRTVKDFLEDAVARWEATEEPDPG